MTKSGVLGTESWGEGGRERRRPRGRERGPVSKARWVRVLDSGLGGSGSSPGFVVAPQISVLHLGLPDKIQDN